MFLQMWNQRPTLTKFGGDQVNLNVCKQMCKSFVYGGSVMESIRVIVKSKDPEKEEGDIIYKENDMRLKVV